MRVLRCQSGLRDLGVDHKKLGTLLCILCRLDIMRWHHRVWTEVHSTDHGAGWSWLLHTKDTMVRPEGAKRPQRSKRRREAPDKHRLGQDEAQAPVDQMRSDARKVIELACDPSQVAPLSDLR